jgi:hypothetical protein
VDFQDRQQVTNSRSQGSQLRTVAGNHGSPRRVRQANSRLILSPHQSRSDNSAASDRNQRAPVRTIGAAKGFRGNICTAFRIGVCGVIDPRADRKASHQPRIVGLQHLCHHSHVRKPRIEPQVVVIGIGQINQDFRHSVVDGSGYSVRRRGKNRARSDPIAARVFPSLPEFSEREQLTVVDLEAIYGSLVFPARTHS